MGSSPAFSARVTLKAKRLVGTSGPVNTITKGQLADGSALKLCGGGNP